MTFKLHPKLAADSHLVGKLRLCDVLLMDDSQYPWLILVPRKPDLREVYDLDLEDQTRLWQEVTECGQQLMQMTRGYKLNLGALGNQVPQLHIHVIARSEHDPAWPGPVWGVSPPQSYNQAALSSQITSLQSALGIQA